MVSPEHPYQAVLMRDLKAQVEALKAVEAGSPGAPGGGQAMYEVYTRTEAAKFTHLSKVLALWEGAWLCCMTFDLTARGGGEEVGPVGGVGWQ